MSKETMKTLGLANLWSCKVRFASGETDALKEFVTSVAETGFVFPAVGTFEAMRKAVEDGYFHVYGSDGHLESTINLSEFEAVPQAEFDKSGWRKFKIVKKKGGVRNAD